MNDERGKRARMGRSAARLLLFPSFLHGPLAADDTFRSRMAVEFGDTLVFDNGAVSFDSEKFHAATELLYASGDDYREVEDIQGKFWTLSFETPNDDASALTLARDATRYRLQAAPMVLPDAGHRRTAFARLLRDAGFPPEHFAEWRSLVSERTLTSREIDALEAHIEASPIVTARLLSQELASATSQITSLAPPLRAYYEAFAGTETAVDLAQFRETILPDIVARWLGWNEDEGAKMALLLSSHGSFSTARALADLDPTRLVALAWWATGEADLLSKLGMVELGLSVLARVPDLATPLKALVEELRDLDPVAAGTRIRLLMASFILVDTELCRSRALAGLAPFQRRIASLAQASLIERVAFGQVDVAHFSEWALDGRGRHFALRSLIDMRSEPRWAPEGATPERLHAEFLGRLLNAASAHAGTIEDGELRRLLIGSGPDSIAERIQFPESFLPGPIEGGIEPAPEPPQKFRDILDRTLGGEALTSQSVIALINISSLFEVESERIDRVIELIRAASFQFSGHMDIVQRNLLLDGLARVAAVTRRTDLATDLRTMLRQLRLEKDLTLPASREFIICLTAAAAHVELADWAAFAGDCAHELALEVSDTEEAHALRSDLVILCSLEPQLRATTCRALAALDAFLGL